MSLLITPTSRFTGFANYDPALAQAGAASEAVIPGRQSQAESLIPTILSPVKGGSAPQDVTASAEAAAKQAAVLQKYADKANAQLNQSDTHLQFKVSQLTGRVVISVIDSETNAVLRQIPPETMEQVVDHISQMRGVLISARG